MGEKKARGKDVGAALVPDGLCPYPVHVWAIEEEGALYVTVFPPPGLTANERIVLGWSERGMPRDELVRRVGEAVVRVGLGKDPRKGARNGS
jgi:hypothetical protein